MAGFDGRIVGFHLRVRYTVLRSYWAPVFREQHWLNPSVDTMKSADHSVWPDLDSPMLLSALFEDYSTRPFSAPNGLSLYQVMRPGFANSASVRETDGVLVGIGLGDAWLRTIGHTHCILPPSPEVTRVAGQLPDLGFDVCDRWLVSGLSNCGLPELLDATSRQDWSRLLNEHGLFSEAGPAERLARYLDGAIPEHAPFAPVMLSALPVAEVI